MLVYFSARPPICVTGVVTLNDQERHVCYVQYFLYHVSIYQSTNVITRIWACSHDINHFNDCHLLEIHWELAEWNALVGNEGPRP